MFRSSVVPSLDSRRRTGLCPLTNSIERVGNLFLLFSASINSLICGKCANCQLQIINFAPMYFFWSSCSTEVQQELHSSTSFWFFTNSLSSSHFSHSSSLVNPRRRQFSVNAARTLIVKSSNTKARIEFSISSHVFFYFHFLLRHMIFQFLLSSIFQLKHLQKQLRESELRQPDLTHSSLKQLT